MQYFVSAIVISNYFIWKKLNQKNTFNKIILAIVSIYAFIISNLYVIDLFSHIFHSFTLTIYWWLIASGLLYYWIQKDIIKYRTIWLYFLTLTTLKIFAYDVWVNFWDTNSRIAVLWVLWVIFIIISTLYTKKYWDNLLKEFSLKNLKDNNKDTTPLSTKEEKISTLYKKSTKKEEENKQKTKLNFTKKTIKADNKANKKGREDFNFMKILKKVNVDDIKVVRFFSNSWNIFRVRAKNLIRIVKIITQQLWKNNFEAWELNEIYNYVIKNYKSELSRREYDKIRTTIKEFIDDWGKVELVKK